VVGTLAGVLITAVAGLITTVVTLRDQRQVASDQASLQLTQRVRDDRKEAFVEYLSAYRLMLDSAQKIASNDEFANLREREGNATTPRRFEMAFPEVASQYGRSYYMLQIIAGSETREAAKKANDALWKLAQGSFSVSKEEFQALDLDTSRTRKDMRNAMRSDLGVSG
jgi:hypothetical protein